MALNKFSIIMILIILAVSTKTFANLDSLVKELSSMKDDTNKINLLNKISKTYKDINTDTGIEYGHSALELAVKLDYKLGIAESYKNIGTNYWRMGTYDIALDYNFKALNIYEEINEIYGVAITYNNIGLIYFARNQYDKAIDYLNRSISLSNSINDNLAIARSQMNLGIIYYEEKKIELALEYHFISLKTCIVMNDSGLISTNYCFMGKSYLALKNFDSAFNYLLKSYDIFNKLNNPNDIAMIDNQLALYYNKKGNYKKSLLYTNSAFDLGGKIDNKYMQMEALGLMSESYFGLKRYKDAYLYHIKFKELQDTLQNEDNIRSTAQKEIQYVYDKKMNLMEIAQQNEHYKNTFIIYSAFIFSAVLLLGLIIIFIFYKAKTKANKTLTNKNLEIQTQKNELLLLNTKLQDLNNTKDKFFSIIAHDLKSPFSGFLGLTKIMAEDIQSLSIDQIQNYSKDLKDLATNLYKLLENLLEWSRIQRGLTEFNPESCMLSFIVRQNIEIVNEIAKQKNIEITFNIPGDNLVTADIQMLNTILRNLISNAIKFTLKGGKIDIGTMVPPDDSKALYNCVYVRDNGIGMNKETMSKLFNLDQLVTQPGTENEPGTGLGLLLCKEFIEKHGGKIWVESEAGSGSTFYFTLPK